MISCNFAIIGMHCNGCVRTVTNALKNVSGVSKVDVSLQENSAAIELNDNETNAEELRKAIREAGYDVSN